MIPVNLREWERLSPSSHPRLANAHLDPDLAVKHLVKSLSESGVLHIDDLHGQGIAIRATSYVGRVGIGRFLITVRPKIDNMRLLRLLRYAYGLRNFRALSRVPFDIEEATFVDILVVQLAVEAEEILSRGMRREYVRREEALAVPRGKLDFVDYVRRAGRNEVALPCIFHPRREDCLPNRMLLGGLNLGADLAVDQHLRLRLRRLASRIAENVTPAPLDRHLLDRFRQTANRLTRAYVPAAQLARLLLEGLGVSLGGAEERVAAPGFLMDMNRFFQSLLTRFLTENAAGYEVRDEFPLRGVMRYTPQHNPRARRSPTPRPDFAVFREGRVRLFLDAKYRDLWDTRIPRDMLYQLAMYALLGCDSARAIILYPALQDRPDQEIEVRNPLGSKRRAFVVLRAANLGHMEALVTATHAAAGERERRSYARWLVQETTT